MTNPSLHLSFFSSSKFKPFAFSMEADHIEAGSDRLGKMYTSPIEIGSIPRASVGDLSVCMLDSPVDFATDSVLVWCVPTSIDCRAYWLDESPTDARSTDLSRLDRWRCLY
ncbi:hypothetical protein OROHE_012176 [Orobanche hederae]